MHKGEARCDLVGDWDTLKTKSRRDANFVVTSGTRGRYDVHAMK